MITTNQDGMQKLKILVADDVEINRTILETILTDFGHSVTVVDSGEEATRAMQQGAGNFDLVFMDIEMPSPNGLQASKIIRDMEASLKRRHTPIIAMSAYTPDDALEQYREAGIDYQIDKPFNKANIQGVLRSLSDIGISADSPLPAESETATIPEVKAAAVFNQAELVERCGNHDSHIAEYIAMFREDMDQLLPALEDALRTGAREAAVGQAHAIKGVAGSICAERMYDVGVMLHIAARSGSMADISMHTEALRHEYERFKAAVSQFQTDTDQGTGTTP